jgi:FdhD protein
VELRALDRTCRAPVLRRRGPAVETVEDELAVEEPLEVRLATGEEEPPRSVAVTLRTPGHDFELVAGFLYSEGVLTDGRSLRSLRYCPGEGPQQYNIVEAGVRPGPGVDLSTLSRAIFTSSSCGLCGRAALEMVRNRVRAKPRGSRRWSSEELEGLPSELSRSQKLFVGTGGTHGAGLFDGPGAPRLVREDVGRHNAVDKVVGALLLAGSLPASETLLLVSGRTSFELAQKAALAGIPVLASVGAPSSLAVELCREMGMTLVGFLGPKRFNVYTGAERIEGSTPDVPLPSPGASAGR